MEAVAYRDRLTHYQLEGLVRMHTPLQKSDPCYTRDTIRPPTLPNVGGRVLHLVHRADARSRETGARTSEVKKPAADVCSYLARQVEGTSRRRRCRSA
jgi:hypothetical protein